MRILKGVFLNALIMAMIADLQLKPVRCLKTKCY